LVFDDLGQGKPLPRAVAARIVRAILERKYGARCPEGYIDRVVASIKDDPVRLREPRYVAKETVESPARRPKERRIALIFNDKHQIHHVRERGYVESPVRIASILAELDRTPLFERIALERFPLRHIQAVHDRDFVRFLRRASANVPPGKSVYPY